MGTVKESEKTGKGKRSKKRRTSLKFKMLGGTLGIVAVGMMLLMLLSINTCANFLRRQIDDTADAELRANVNDVDGTLERFRTTAMDISRYVSNSYKTTDINVYKDSIIEIIKGNDMILGSGLWFEPNVFDPNEKYMGPYWYKDGDKIEETYEYSNEDYDYFNQEYYTNAKAIKTLDAMITDPYYDPTSGIIMATCSAPIFDPESGTYIGCVTVDMSLDSIKETISAISFGENGPAMLVDSKGVYLYDDVTSKVTDGKKIMEESEPSFAQAGKEIMSGENGIVTYTDNGVAFTGYYSIIPKVNWRLILKVPTKQNDAPVYQLGNQMALLSVFVLVVSAVVILILISKVVNQIVKIQKFTNQLAAGNFTISKLSSKSNDEIGQMSDSLDDMYESNKNIINKIADSSGLVSEASENLTGVAGNLNDRFSAIRERLADMNDAMMSMSAATEEVNASVQEINASIEHLSAETQTTTSNASSINKKASSVEERSRLAYENAISIAKSRGKELETAASKADIVNDIGDLASTIAEIAEQINLLSLNASIEAARAGEHGKGFAVVATEINKLATETAEAVEKIQMTVDGVQNAFQSLANSSTELLEFVKDTVSPDYDYFAGIGKEYGADATTFGKAAEKIDVMVDNIRRSINEVSTAIQNIAESATDSAAHSAEIVDTVNEVSEVIGNVTDMSSEQENVAADLNGVVGQFKLK
ncbi:MAG: methyl-accepting chemotaxis protein [Lachnospiraceae bacterium]|nr:methyl-accepting chemotaxis protein [Lachnospiraceae bacterium]